MLWGIYSAIYGEVNVSVEKCVEIKGDYVEKQFYFCHLKKLVRPETFGPYYVREWLVHVLNVFSWLLIGTRFITRIFSTIWPIWHDTSYRCVCVCVCVCVCAREGGNGTCCRRTIHLLEQRGYTDSLWRVFVQEGELKAYIDQACDLKHFTVSYWQVFMHHSERFTKAFIWKILRRRKYTTRYQPISLKFKSFICQMVSYKQVSWHGIVLENDRETERETEIKQFCKFKDIFSS